MLGQRPTSSGQQTQLPLYPTIVYKMPRLKTTVESQEPQPKSERIVLENNERTRRAQRRVTRLGETIGPCSRSIVAFIQF